METDAKYLSHWRLFMHERWELMPYFGTESKAASDSDILRFWEKISNTINGFDSFEAILTLRGPGVRDRTEDYDNNDIFLEVRAPIPVAPKTFVQMGSFLADRAVKIGIREVDYRMDFAIKGGPIVPLRMFLSVKDMVDKSS